MSDVAKDPLADRALPAWFDDAKFAIFIHWGMFSVPSWAPVARSVVNGHEESRLAEEYQNSMAVPQTLTAAYHAEHYGHPYDVFADQFQAGLNRWDPDAWADLFARAGARYVILTVKTEDGFLLWPSAQQNPHRQRWQSERDMVGELSAALATRGIRFGTYYAGMDWTFSPNKPPASFESSMPQSEEWMAYADAHWRELIQRYQPAILWPDFGFPTSDRWNRLMAWYYEQVPDGVVNDRFTPLGDEPAQSGVHRDFATIESMTQHFDPAADTYANPEIETDKKWESCRQMGRSWGYNRHETDASYSSSSALIQELVDVTARGGNLLLNVGPTATGEIPWLQAQRLVDIGWWLDQYGTAIFGTRPWLRPTGTTTEGQHIRYTVSADAVHAIILGTPHLGAPTNPHVELDVRLDAGAQVFLADQTIPLEWSATEHGTRVTLPEQPAEQPAIAFRLTPKEAVHG